MFGWTSYYHSPYVYLVLSRVALHLRQVRLKLGDDKATHILSNLIKITLQSYKKIQLTTEYLN